VTEEGGREVRKPAGGERHPLITGIRRSSTREVEQTVDDSLREALEMPLGERRTRSERARFLRTEPLLSGNSFDIAAEEVSGKKESKESKRRNE